jgi:hypothetical protein
MVQIASKQQRGFWAVAVINLVPDILVSAGGSYILDWGGPGFLGIFIGLQAVYFALWLKRMLWVWFLFWLSNRRKSADHIEEYLFKNQFPQPPEYVGGVENYLSEIADDKALHPALRVKAAAELGSLNGIKAAGQWTVALQTSIAFEDALVRYSKRFPPRLEQYEDESARQNW